MKYLTFIAALLLSFHLQAEMNEFRVVIKEASKEQRHTAYDMQQLLDLDPQYYSLVDSEVGELSELHEPEPLEEEVSIVLKKTETKTKASAKRSPAAARPARGIASITHF